MTSYLRTVISGMTNRLVSNQVGPLNVEDPAVVLTEILEHPVLNTLPTGTHDGQHQQSSRTSDLLMKLIRVTILLALTQVTYQIYQMTRLMPAKYQIPSILILVIVNSIIVFMPMRVVSWIRGLTTAIAGLVNKFINRNNDDECSTS
jgi:hypothetical protein